MSIRTFQNISPQIDKTAYIDPDAVIIGDVFIDEDASVWPNAVLRGDVHKIQIGKRSSIQDGCVCHVTHKSHFQPEGIPLIVGNDVTVGHSVILHACTIGDESLIGMGSILLDGCVIGTRVLLGAGSLVSPGMQLESGYLYIGRPAVKKRALTEEELRYFSYSASHYVKLKNQYLTL